MARGGGGAERRDGRRRGLGVLEVGVEAADVPGDVRVDRGDEPGDRLELVGAPSFRPGTTSVVTSTQIPSVFISRIESRTGSRRAPQVFL